MGFKAIIALALGLAAVAYWYHSEALSAVEAAFLVGALALLGLSGWRLARSPAGRQAVRATRRLGSEIRVLGRRGRRRAGRR